MKNALRRSLENKAGNPAIVFLSDEQSKSKLLCFYSSLAKARTAVASEGEQAVGAICDSGKYVCILKNSTLSFLSKFAF